MTRAGLVVAAAFVGVALALGGMAAHTVGAWRAEVHQLETLDDTIATSASYDHAVDGVNSLTLESLAFVTGPTPQRRARFDASLAAVLADFDAIEARGTPADRALVQSLRASVLPQLATAQAFFDALLAGTPYVGPVPDQRITESIRAVLTTPAADHHQEMQEQIEQRIAEERAQLAVSLATYSAALALLLVFLLALRHHELRLLRVRAQTELEQLRRAAFTDVITELFNFRSFIAALDYAAAGAGSRNAPVTLALLDIDEFHLLSEAEGAERADDLLRELAAVLREDCPGGAFRVGHDRFALLLEADREQALARLDRLRAVAAERLPMLTMSVGVSALDGAAVDAAMLREQAEAALHAAQRRGRDTIVFFQDAGAVVDPAFTGAKTAAVHRAISERRMNAAFQPIFDLHSGELRAFEALARTPADLGLSGPQEAFDIADRTGHTHELDSICRAAAFAGAEALPPGVRLFLNIAPWALLHRDFSPDALAAEARAAGLDPARIVVEVTERAGVPAATLALHGAHLRAAGFGLALDDVGAGNAGLETLRHMTVDVIKIDRMVIANAATDRASRAVLYASVDFGAESGAEVDAEGIETAAELALIRSVAGPSTLGGAPRIHLVQGYLFGRRRLPSPTATHSSPPDARSGRRIRSARRCYAYYWSAPIMAASTRTKGHTHGH